MDIAIKRCLFDCQGLTHKQVYERSTGAPVVSTLRLKHQLLTFYSRGVSDTNIYIFIGL